MYQKNLILYYFLSHDQISILLFVLKGVEKGLVEQINYLTEVATGQPHEGSIYGAEKVTRYF